MQFTITYDLSFKPRWNEKSEDLPWSSNQNGADTSIVHASNGLSAFGHFRDSFKQEERSSILWCLPEPSAEAKEEVFGLKRFIRPADGPTSADGAILETKKESDLNDDESD